MTALSLKRPLPSQDEPPNDERSRVARSALETALATLDEEVEKLSNRHEQILGVLLEEDIREGVVCSGPHMQVVKRGRFAEHTPRHSADGQHATEQHSQHLQTSAVGATSDSAAGHLVACRTLGGISLSSSSSFTASSSHGIRCLHLCCVGFVRILIQKYAQQ